MKGKAYGVGVGPGDPELMTLKAVRIIKENDIIAVPGKVVEESVAYKIAVQTVPELKNKTLVPLYMPMVLDREAIRKNHDENAKEIEKYLDEGKNVVYITLGDSTVYCTFTYIQHILEEDGYETELINGIPSFCAAAARMNIPLAEWNEDIHIIPASHKKENPLEQSGNYVLMKSASYMKDVKENLKRADREVFAVENCGLPNENIYRSADEIPDKASYFSLIIAKEKN